MGFLSTLRRLFTYLMSSRNSDNVEPPANLILFGDPNAVDGVANKSPPLCADAYLWEFMREARISMADLTVQSCVTRVDFCKRLKKGLQHEYLVAHVVYYSGGRTHRKYSSVAVIDRVSGGKRCSGNLTFRAPAVEVSSSPPASPPAPAPLSEPTHPSAPTPPCSPTLPSAASAPTPPESPPSTPSASSSSDSLESSGNSLSKVPNDTMMIHYGKKRPHSLPEKDICASMDFDDAVPEKRVSFERLVCMLLVAHKLGENYNVGGKNCYWMASWIWDALLLSELPRSWNDDYPGSRKLGGLSVLGTQVRTIHNNGQTHPCGALVRSNNAVAKADVKECNEMWEKLQAKVRETIEEELRRKTELQDAKARAVTEAQLRAEAETRATEAETRAAEAERELALLRASLNPPAPKAPRGY